MEQSIPPAIGHRLRHVPGCSSPPDPSSPPKTTLHSELQDFSMGLSQGPGARESQEISGNYSWDVLFEEKIWETTRGLEGPLVMRAYHPMETAVSREQHQTHQTPGI